MNNKNENKKRHSNNLVIILTIIVLGIATTTGGAVYATQIIDEDLVVGKTDARHYLLISSSQWPELRYQTPTDDGVIRLGVAHADNSGYGVLAGDWYTYSAQTSRMDLIVPKAGGVHLAANGGNVDIGTTNPNSKLEVTNGYIELDTSSGLPPTTDCDNADEIGRMKVDDSSLTLYVCGYDGSAHTWMTILGDSITPAPQSPSPIIISLIADDPDDGDIIYSAGDTITINFDSDTNEPGGTGTQTKTAVDNLFTFTESLGQPYRGQWTAADTFTITINGLRNVGPPVIGVTTVTPSGITPILSADGTSEQSTITSSVLSGDFGIQ